MTSTLQPNDRRLLIEMEARMQFIIMAFNLMFWSMNCSSFAKHSMRCNVVPVRSAWLFLPTTMLRKQIRIMMKDKLCFDFGLMALTNMGVGSCGCH
jgi:hypothetical protein